MSDLFDKFNIDSPEKETDLFDKFKVKPESITESNINALNNAVKFDDIPYGFSSGVTGEQDYFTPDDYTAVKKENDDQREQFAKMASTRFSAEQIKSWRDNPIGFFEAPDYLDIEDVAPLGGLKKAADTFGIYNISEKMKTGESLTDDESETMNTYIDKTIEMRTRGFSFGGKVAYHGLPLPAVMIEFALSGGVGKLALKGATKALGKTVEKIALSGIAAKTAGVVAGVAARTAAMPAMYVPTYAERRLNDYMAVTDKGDIAYKESKESPAMSALKAFSYTGAEVASELSGVAIGKYLVKPIGRAVVAPVARRLKTPLVDGINQLPVKLKNGLYSAYKAIQPNAQVSKVFTKAGWNGMIEELGEERVNAILQETINYTLEENYTFDDVLKGITPTGEQLALEASLIAIVGGAGTAASIAKNTLYDRGYTRAEAKEAVDNMSAIEQEAFADSQLKLNPDYDSVRNKIYDKIFEATAKKEESNATANVVASNIMWASKELGLTPDAYLDSLGIDIQKTEITDEGLFQSAGGKALESLGYFKKKYKLHNLKKAKKMAEKGMHHTDVLEKTGWYFDKVDGERTWKFEISDKDTSIKIPDNILIEDIKNNTLTRKYGLDKISIGGKKYKLDDFLIHEKLFSFYPELKKTTIRIAPVDMNIGVRKGVLDTGGTFDKRKNHIDILVPFNSTNIEKEIPNIKNKIIDYLLHEIQHTIQYIEQFPASKRGVPYKERIEEIEAFNTSFRKDMSEKQRKRIHPVNTAMDDLGFRSILFQQKKGSIQFKDGKTIISLFETADASTLIHESAHMFINELERIAPNSETAQRYWNTLNEWSGLNTAETPEKRTIAIEKMARGFESYMREGKTPNARLKGAFEHFKTWLKTIYKSVKGLNVKINDDVRAVFDGILSFENEVISEQMRKYNENNPPPINDNESNFDKIYREWFNLYQPVEDLVKEAKKSGVDILAGECPTLLGRTYAGNIGRTQQNLQIETFVLNKEGHIEVTGKAMKPILDDWDNSVIHIEPDVDTRRNDFNDYLIAVRNIEDLQIREDVELSEKDLLDSTESMTRLALKYGEDFTFFETFSNELYDFQKRILQNFVTSGVMSKEMYDGILKANPHYVPFQRILEQDEFSEFVSQKGIFTEADKRKVIKKIKGSEKEIKDVFHSILKNTAKILDISSRNQVAKSIVNLRGYMPEYIQQEKVPMHKITVKSETGEDITTYRPTGYAPPNTMTVFNDGKKEYYTVSKPILEAVNQLQPVQLGFLEKMFTLPGTFVRIGATLVPEFWVRNVLRDQSTAFIQSEIRPTPVDMVRGLFAVMGKNELYNDWIKSGASFNSYMDLSDTGVESAYKELFRENGRMWRYLKNPLNIPADISMALEQATRIGVFAKATRKGLSAIESGFEAREATLDFARGGSKSKVANRIIPFFNAGMQGTDKLFRTLKTNPKASILWATATITLPSLALTGYYLYEAPEDEREEYLEIPQWQKDLFWCFKRDGEWVRLPKPFSFGYMFGSLPEKALTWMYKGDKPEGEGFYNEVILGLFGAVSPVYDASALIPPALKLPIEFTTNHNFFTGRPIHPDWMNRLPPEERTNKYTSETAKLIGKQIGQSPAKIDNLIRGTIAGSANYLTGAGDLILKQVREWNDEELPEKPKVLADYPIVKAFVMRSPDGYRTISTSNFFKNWKEIQEIHTAFGRKEGEEKREYRDKHENILRAYKPIKAVYKQIRTLGKQIDRIYDDKDMKSQEKVEQISAFEEKILTIAKRGNIMYKDMTRDTEK